MEGSSMALQCRRESDDGAVKACRSLRGSVYYDDGFSRSHGGSCDDPQSNREGGQFWFLMIVGGYARGAAMGLRWTTLVARDRISQGFNRELQDLVLKLKLFSLLEKVLQDEKCADRVREQAGLAVAAMIGWRNKF
ncbi:hypothetical protein LR48_Vigan09g009400 [Vigna angularis]|uniref:Uncharacterized protein n=1 Tax=Phaseolus angularis TaxID=3914 RepID=A0A0L9V8L6_PHAAN|nr:hypothetical protein LR48_Vigan09g009400 [Vigna angularis]